MRLYSLALLNFALACFVPAAASAAPGHFSLIGPVITAPTDHAFVTWGAADGAANYDVYVSPNNDLSFPIFTQNGLTATSSGVFQAPAAGTYYAGVTARDAALGTTSGTNNGLAFQLNAPLADFSITQAAFSTSSFASPTPGISVSWQNNANAESRRPTSWDVFLSQHADLSAPVRQVNVPVGACSNCSQTALLDGPFDVGDYYIGVRANHDGFLSKLATNSALQVNVPYAPNSPKDLPPGSVYHQMFVTSFATGIDSIDVYPPFIPFFSGMDAADFLATYAAEQAGLLTEPWDQFTPVWKAVLSQSGSNAKDRIAINGPIYNMQGQLIAAGHADLWDGSLANPVKYDEYGNEVTTTLQVWTGTIESGLWDTNNSCGGWNNSSSIATGGIPTASNATWIVGTGMNCSQPARLYAISPAITVTAVLPSEVENSILPPEEIGEVIDTEELPGVTAADEALIFENVPSGEWFDPVSAFGFLYTMTSESLFTDILGFPPGFADPFTVWAEGQNLGQFLPGQSLDFVAQLGHGVHCFAITGIVPGVDPLDPMAFPLRLAFDTETASFSMRGLFLDSQSAAAAVPEPGCAALLLALVPLVRRRRRRQG